MPHFLKEIRTLQSEGKLHSRLVVRVRMLLIISIILLAVVIYLDIASRGSLLVELMLAIGGFLLGMFIFSRMNVVQWNDEAEHVEAASMDRLGYIILALYIAFEIGLRTILKDYFSASATVFILASVFGLLFGRVVGMLIEIHRVYRASRTG